jgi:hypothetical protein
MIKSDNKNLFQVIMEEKSSDLINYNNRTVQNMYDNILENMEEKKARQFAHWDTPDIMENEHRFRSPSFTKDVDYLFSGCSVTYGIGLQKNHLWYEQLMQELKGSYSCVAMHGDSIPGQVLKIFAYIKEFGNPKNIIALFPDLNRFLVFNNQNLFCTQRFLNNVDSETYKWAFIKNQDDSSKEYINFLIKSNAITDHHSNNTSYFKRPLIADDVITEEMAHFYSAQFINMLSMYCKIANINLIYSTWNHTSSMIFDKLKPKGLFPEYVSMYTERWVHNNLDRASNKNDLTDVYKYENNIINCHQEHLGDEHFHVAMDRGDSIEHAHFGFHRHIHYYEEFLKYLKKDIK